VSNSTINVINPANEEVLATVDCFDPEQVNETVLKSEKAFLSWSSFSPRTKVKKLHEIADLIDRNLEVLARIESSNTGKPIGDARWEIAEAAYVFHYFAGIIENHRGSTIPVEGGIDLTIPEPLGVVAGIVPWNFPFLISSWKIAPAIACGNSVILKPAELTPLSALKFKELLKEVDLPQDLILIAPGYGHITGVALVENP
jgi:acyl-CoA reductase-like NAD-dependent aldehyde dehydrogenase